MLRLATWAWLNNLAFYFLRIQPFSLNVFLFCNPFVKPFYSPILAQFFFGPQPFDSTVTFGDLDIFIKLAQLANFLLLTFSQYTKTHISNRSELNS